MKRTSVTLIIAFIASLCTQQVVCYSINDREGESYLLTLNVCAASHDALSQDNGTPCITESVFEFVTHAQLSRYPTPAFVGFDYLPPSERAHPPRFLA
jgi:hypothetical protein